MPDQTDPKDSRTANSSGQPVPRASKCQRTLQRELDRRIATRQPAYFAAITSPAELTPWQIADAAATTPAWQYLAWVSDQIPQFWRAYIERPRGHSKTTDIATAILWSLVNSRRTLTGLVAAADRDQATHVRRAMQLIQQKHPHLCADVEIQNHAAVNTRTQSRIDLISSDVNSSWGATPDFVICDELCHWPKPDLWHSLASAAAKKTACLLIVLTNAGIGHGWQWAVREHARHDPGWYYHSLIGPQAPWISPAKLAEQERLLPPSVYARLWLNQWQDSGGEFVSLTEAEACCDEERTPSDGAKQGTSYIAAVDYAEKHDLTVCCILHREQSGLIVDRMDVIRPTPQRPTQITTVEEWIRVTNATFPGIRTVVDEYQLLGTIQRLEQSFWIERFNFSAGQGNHALALNLRQLIVSRGIRWYPHCGQIPGEERRDDLETELSQLRLDQSSAGRCRIDHIRDGYHHDDRSFALGVAALAAVRGMSDGEQLTISHMEIFT